MIPFSHTDLEQIAQRVKTGSTLIHTEALMGGASAQVILLDIRHLNGEMKKYLLRVHSEIDRTRNPHVASHEFKLLAALYAAGLPVPQPHYLDVSGEVFAIPYLVVDYIEGATHYAPQNLPNFLQQSVELLAKIHQIKQKLPLGEGAALDFLSNRAEHVLWWIGYQPEQLDEELDEGPLRDTLRGLFPLNQVNDDALLHGDFWAGNLIWQDGKLVGVIDWEDAEIGDPLSDLSIARLDILWAFGQTAMQDFTRAYQTLMPHLDYSNLPQWDLFSALRPANQLAAWAAMWKGYGRSDVTSTTMREAHHWFVQQAKEQL